MTRLIIDALDTIPGQVVFWTALLVASFARCT